MPEVHIIGEIVGASGFPSSNLFCKWKVVADKQHWEKLEGAIEGQSQADYPVDDEEMAIFSHPLDAGLNFNFKYGIKIGLGEASYVLLCVSVAYTKDGYGFCHIPTTPGSHELEVVTWRPAGSFFEEVRAWFLGGAPQLRNDDLVLSGADRFRLKTISMGKVHLRVGVILKDMNKSGVQW